jgi:hypothetical protein
VDFGNAPEGVITRAAQSHCVIAFDLDINQRAEPGLCAAHLHFSTA